MYEPLGSILLIEDCDADIYLHSRVIRHLDVSRDLLITRSGDEAIQLLHSNLANGIPIPDLIFLDINIPGMEAWEFVSQFSALDEDLRKQSVIVMLSGSMNPDDRSRADDEPAIREYRQKPLTREAMSEILERYFSRKRFET